MGKKRTEILIGPNGEAEIEAFGFKGKLCQVETQFLADALGTTKDTKKKAEWFIANAESIQTAKQRGYNAAKLCG